ncbi:MAG: Gfo/Idh/MocA family oxidoreductase [bacterium]
MKRRTFLTTTLLGSGACFTRCLASEIKRRTLDANEKLNHACIGVGGMGYHDFKNFLSHPKTQIVAICDVDKDRLSRASKDAPSARCYTDWRELLAAEGNKIDSVSITVPDHMHALIALTAMSMGKHVYCQKPLCHDVAECRQLINAAAHSGVVTQLGTQHASGMGDRLGVHFLKQNHIGTLKKMVLCSNRSGVIGGCRLAGPRPPSCPPPDTLNWDHWIGTAPLRDYAPKVYHPGIWRTWLDFGTGWSGDIGCHIFDAAWKGFDLTAPLSVKAEVQESWKNSKERRADLWPQGQHITWEFGGIPQSGNKPFTMEWFDGEFYPPEDAQEYARMASFAKFPEEALLVFGSEGAMLLPHTSGAILLPKNKFVALPKPKLEPRNHYHHFLDAARGEAQNESYFQRTGPMAETILLGTVAIRVPDTKLEWDAKGMRITNNEEATKLLSRPYRKGWEFKG